MKSDGSVIIDTRMNTKGFKQGVVNMKQQFDGLGKSVKKLGFAIASVFAVAQIVEFGKESIKLGSDLQEVQNVVDSVFTTMSDNVDEFAKSAAESAGLSEVMAKRYAGTFGAMSKSFGFAENEAYEMSTALTQLAGDVASFYNISQDEAYTKLKSVFTGETETLKELGVVMTQNALDSYAMANGYGKTTQAMTEQEKVALRYRFVMDQLSTASGDFLRTSDGWANQVRVLKLNFDSLRATIGQGLINIFTPVIKVINILLGKLATVANAFKSFTELITGKKSSGATSASSAGLTSAALSDTGNAYNSAAEGAENLAGATEDVADATEKANKAQRDYLSGLDEVRKLETDSYSGTSGGGAGLSGVSGAVGSVDYGNLAEGETAVEKLDKKFKNFYETINEGLQKIYDAINWENVGPKITYFVDSFTSSFNSLVDNIDWDLIGQVVGAGVNTIVNTLNRLIEGIDWPNLGKSFSSGIMGLVDEVNWKNFGNLISNKFMIAWKTFYGFVTNLDYKVIGTALSELINGAIEKIDLGMIFAALSVFAVGILQMLSTAIQNTDWTAVGQQIADALRAIDWIGIASGLFDVGLQLISGLLDAFEELPLPVQLAAAAVGGFFLAFNGYTIIQSAIGLITGAGGIIPALSAFVSALGGPVTLAIAGIIAIGTLLIANWDDIKEMAKKVWEYVKKTFSDAAKAISSTASSIWNGITNFFKNTFETIKNTASSVWNSMKNTASSIWNGIKTTLSNLWNSIKSTASNVFNAVKKSIDSVWNGLKNTTSRVWNGIKNTLSTLWHNLTSTARNAGSIIKNAFVNAFDSIKRLIKTPINAVIGMINGLIRGVVSGINAVFRAFNKLSVNVPSWVPGIGGKRLGFNFTYLTAPSIPYLATGAVIPPNAPFMAMLGDQKNGNNIEAPEDLIRKIVREETQGQGFSGEIRIPIILDGRQVYEAVVRQADLARSRSGGSLFGMT